MIRRRLTSPITLYAVSSCLFGAASLTAALLISAAVHHRLAVVQMIASLVFILINALSGIVVVVVANSRHDCPFCLCIRQSSVPTMAREMTPKNVTAKLAQLSERRARKEMR